MRIFRKFMTGPRAGVCRNCGGGNAVPGGGRGVVLPAQSVLQRQAHLLLAAAVCVGMPALAAEAPATISVRELPEPLRQQWTNIRPELEPTSRCAAAFDSFADPNRMVFKCSVHIKISAEGTRRALRYCEDERREKGIRSACRLVLN